MRWQAQEKREDMKVVLDTNVLIKK